MCEKAVGKVRALEASVGWSSTSLLRPLVVMSRGAVDREPVIQAVQSLGSRMAVKHGRGSVMGGYIAECSLWCHRTEQAPRSRVPPAALLAPRHGPQAKGLDD